MNPGETLKELSAIILLAAVSSAIIFTNLDASNLEDWDEARHGQNALEMLWTKDPVVTYFAGVKDDWNYKPPLGAWLTVLSFLYFGTGVWSLRFFPALFGVGVVLVTYLFTRKSSDRTTGLIAASLLLVNEAFLFRHGARHGEYDTMLVFFTLAALYSFRLYIEKERDRHLYLTGVLTGLGFMAKAGQGLLPLFSIIPLLALDPTKRRKIRHSLAGILAGFTATSAPWLILRCTRGCRFVTKMFSYDVFTRALTPIEGKEGGPLYYMHYMHETLPAALNLALLAGFLYGLIRLAGKKSREPILTLHALAVIMVFTFSQTKNYWYLLPAYPALSSLAAFFIMDAAKKLGALRRPAILTTLIILSVSLHATYEKTLAGHYIDGIQNSIMELGVEISESGRLCMDKKDYTQSRYFLANIQSGRRVRLCMEGCLRGPGCESILTLSRETYDKTISWREYGLYAVQEKRYLDDGKTLSRGFAAILHRKKEGDDI